MPSLVKIIIESAQDLPIMDRNAQSSDASTDAYVEVRLRRTDEESWTQRTEIRRKTLNPVWNSEFTVEVMDDRVLQDAPVEFRVMDQDLYSSEAIGSVFVDLNPLITRTAYGVTDVKDRLAIKGWFPIFDTSQGINRGFLKLTIKLQFIGNDNPLNSAGVQFFSSSSLSPHCFIIQECIGFVVDLVVEDDPEESWQDYFRNAIKASNLNDSRLKVLYNLSAMVRREVGKKVTEAGGNAVLGYHAQFDMEGSSGLVARAYGTSCRLLKVSNSSVLSVQSEGLQRLRHKHLPVLGPNQPLAIFPTDSFSPFVPYSIRSEGVALGSDPVALLQMSPDGSLSVHQLRSFGSAERPTLLHEKSLFQTEVQLLSLTEFGPHVDVRLGGLVMSRSVKYLGKLEATLSDQETREGWWDELRDEIKKHARVLCCTHVVGYSETCVVIGDVCVLSAIGTAAIIKRLAHPSGYVEAVESLRQSVDKDTKRQRDNLIISSQDDFEEESYDQGTRDRKSFSKDADPRGWRSVSTGSRTSRRPPFNSSISEDARNIRNIKHAWYFHIQSEKSVPTIDMESSTPVFAMSNKEIAVTSSKKESSVADTYNKTYSQSQPDESEVPVKGSKVLYRCIRSNRAPSSCNMAHVPYHHKTAPFAFMRLVPCQVCKRKWVPETILSTIEPPPSLEIRGQGQFLEARICRQRKSGTGEIDAGKISEVLPFVEYDLQRQLMFKLKILGMNAAFGISNTIQIGKNVVVAVSTCTAVYLEALPPPPSLVVSKISKEPYLDEIEAIANANKESLDLAYNAKQRAIALLREVNEGKVALKHVGSSNRKMKPSPRLSSAMASISEHDDQMTEDDNPKYTDPGSSGSFSGVNTSFDDKVGLVTSTSADENYSEAEYDSDTESSSSSSSSSTDSDSSEEDGEESSLESPGGSSSSETSSDTDGDEEDENASKKGNPRRMTSGNNSVDTEHQEVTSRARSLSQNSSDIALVSSGQQQIMKPKRSKPAPRKTRMKFRTIFTDDLPPFVLEIDDETDKDIAAVVSDWNAPDRFDWTNLSFVPGLQNVARDRGYNVTVFHRGSLLKAAGASKRSNKPNSTRQVFTQPVQQTQQNLGQFIADLYKTAYGSLCAKFASMAPCQILAVRHTTRLVEDDNIEIIVTGLVQPIQLPGAFIGDLSSAMDTAGSLESPPTRRQTSESGLESPQNRSKRLEVATSDSGFDVFLPHADSTDVSVPTGSSPSNAEILFRPPLRSFEQSRIDSVPGIAFDGLTRSGPSEDPIRSFNLGSPSLLPSLVTPVESGKMSSSSYLMQNSFDKSDRSKGSKTGKSPQLLQSILEREVLLCPLDKVPGKEVKRYLGPLQLHFVKDAWTGRSDQSSDTYSFIEVASMNAMAHVSSLGGNALLCYKLVMQEPAHKLSSRSHSYTLVTVTGDVVSLGDISQSPIASPTMMSRHTSVGIEMDPVARRTSRVTSSSSVGGGIGQTRDRNTSGSTSTGTLTGLSAEADPKIFRSQSTDASDIAFALAAHSPSSASSSARNK